MLTRRDLATLAWYGALFSAVVFWAALRRGEDGVSDTRSARRIESAPEALDQSEGNAEVRRLIGRMVTP
jgi:hypothetical protein